MNKINHQSDVMTVPNIFKIIAEDLANGPYSEAFLVARDGPVGPAIDVLCVTDDAGGKILSAIEEIRRHKPNSETSADVLAFSFHTLDRNISEGACFSDGACGVFAPGQDVLIEFGIRKIGSPNMYRVHFVKTPANKIYFDLRDRVDALAKQVAALEMDVRGSK